MRKSNNFLCRGSLLLVGESVFLKHITDAHEDEKKPPRKLTNNRGGFNSIIGLSLPDRDLNPLTRLGDIALPLSTPLHNPMRSGERVLAACCNYLSIIGLTLYSLMSLLYHHPPERVKKFHVVVLALLSVSQQVLQRVHSEREQCSNRISQL